jgi:hypothetical protein
MVSEGGRHEPPSTLAPSLKPSSGRYPSFAERGELAIQRAQVAGGAGDLSANGAVGIDDLARTAPECCDARRRPGLSGYHGAVAC